MTTLTLRELISYKGLWHSIKQEHIESILTNNHLEARTTQRYWVNGVIYRDNQKEQYHQSHYMKGWSMTRDKDYAFGWGSVTLLFNWELLRRDFKIRTFSWSYLGSYCKGNFDKEREEFVISNYMSQTIDEIEQEYFTITDSIYDVQGKEALNEWMKENGSNYIDYWQRKGLRTICLSKYLKAIFVCKESYEIYNGRGFDMAVNHPLFKGFINRDESNARHESSMKR